MASATTVFSVRRDSFAVDMMAGLMEDLAAAIVPGATIALDLSACGEADVRLVQLVGAARRHASEVGAYFKLGNPPGFDVDRLLTRAGLDQDSAEKSFWLQGNSNQ